MWLKGSEGGGVGWGGGVGGLDLRGSTSPSFTPLLSFCGAASSRSTSSDSCFSHSSCGVCVRVCVRACVRACMGGRESKAGRSAGLQR